MTHRMYVGVVLVVNLGVSFFVLSRPAEPIAALLFSLPLALCALQESIWLVWATASLAVLMTTAPYSGILQRWSADRPSIATSSPWLLIANFFILALFVRSRAVEARLTKLTGDTLRRQSTELAAQTDRLASMTTAAARDLSARENSAHELSEMESRYHALVEAAPDAMVVVNPAGAIVLVNLQAEKTFGYRRDELLGQPVTAIIPEGFAERILADSRRSTADALAQQIDIGIELNGCRKDGTRFPLEIMLSPLEEGSGVVTVAIRDITGRKKAEAHLQQKLDELRRSNEELEQFASIASHDLQEPLRMVASFTQLLARRYRGKLDTDADEYIAFAVDGASRMQRLIQDLLEYSRVGSGGTVLRPVSSESALRRALVNLQVAIADSGATVTHEPLPMVRGDEVQLTQVFQNLIGNAVKYRGTRPPEIRVAASGGGDHPWTFSVTDNGLGIEPQYFDSIFKMFHRLHKRDEFSGTGIGRAVCKKIVERHGGRISVTSRPGEGSEFTFALAADDRAA